MSNVSPLTLLLVHGAWHREDAWQPLISELPEVQIRTVALPSHGSTPSELGDLYDDAKVVRDATEAIEGPVVVCAHSYGGMPTTEGLAGASAVKRLIYLSAFQLDVGDSLLGSLGGTPPDWCQIHEAEGYIDALSPEETFWGDVAPELQRKLAAQVGHQSLAAKNQPLTRVAWQSIPSTYIICERDAAIPPFAQVDMAKRAERVLRIDSCHCPFLSQPANLAALLREELKLVQATS